MERLLLSITLSIALCPIAITIVARYSSLSIACWFCVAISLVAVFFAIREARVSGWERSFSRHEKIGLWIAVAWAVVAIASLVDLQVGHALFMPAEAFDQSMRAALTGAAARTGVPPANPFFYPGHFVAMRYYYYWVVFCALPAKLFALSPRVCALGGVIWSGFALMAIIPLYLKHFCEESLELGRKSLIGIALLAVTGLDIIPTAMIFLAQHTVLGDMEWWDNQQITSWLDSLLWVPHQIAAVVACLVGFLILWILPRDAGTGRRAKAVMIASLAFASAAGLSVYVTFTFAIFLVIWTLVLGRSRLWSEALMFVATGIITVAVSLAYLHDLQQPGYTGAFATYYVRSLGSIYLWADSITRSEWLRSSIFVLLLPVYYTIELGFFGLIGFAQAWQFWRRPQPLRKWEWASVGICGSSLLVGSFLMSTTGNNDLGYRAMLFSQFILLLWAISFVYRWRTRTATIRRPLRLLVHTFLWLGVLGTLYQLVELRFFTMLVEDGKYTDDISWLPDTDTIAEDVYSVRAGFEELNRKLPKDAIIQGYPLNPAYVPNVYYGLHQSVDGVANCGAPFGGSPFACLPYQYKIVAAFNANLPFTWQEADQLCTDFKIDVLVAERTDRMWALKQSWVWTGRPVMESEFMRAFACGRRRKEIELKFAP